MVYIYSSFIVVVMISKISCLVLNYVTIDNEGLSMDIDIEGLGSEYDGEVIPRSIGLTFPGTKWCGPGNIATSYDDLGPANKTDMCCRTHDHCPDIIKAGQTRYNLTNMAPYTRLNCTCDYEFHDCLHKVNSTISTIVGNMYFNAPKAQCFKKDYPIIGCKRRGGWFNDRCLEYEYNTNGNKTYQWFDLPNY